MQNLILIGVGIFSFLQTGKVVDELLELKQC